MVALRGRPSTTSRPPSTTTSPPTPGPRTGCTRRSRTTRPSRRRRDPRSAGSSGRTATRSAAARPGTSPCGRTIRTSCSRPITPDQTGAEYHATIFAFAESPLEPGVLWAGSDDGLIHLSRDDGKRWTNVTPRLIAAQTLVSIIEPGRHDTGTAYVAANRYKH